MPTSEETKESLIEQLAGLVAVCEVRDRGALEGILAAFVRLEQVCSNEPEPLVRESREALAAHLASDGVNGTAVLARVTANVLALQQGPQSAEAPAENVERDGDTIELMTDFLEEGGDGLSRADEILMAGEEGGLDSGNINELFRVFHSIKGVAGFIDLPQVIAVAHTTETLLDLVREGTLVLAGSALELVFDSTTLMRKLLHEVRAALEGGTTVEQVPEVGQLVKKLQAEIARAALPSGSVVAPVSEAYEIFAAPVPGPGVASVRAPAPDVEGPRQGERIRETLKVDVQRVDSVVEMIGELIIVESMVVNAPELAAIQSLKLRNYLGQLTKISRDLQDVAMRMRMVPVRGVFQKMARLTRDLAHKTGKKVVLVPVGEETEMDRSMAERLEEPLVHMVRNAVDHGVEAGEVRRTQGKVEQATLRLSAVHEGGNIVIELTDDGKGLDCKALLAKARSRGLVGADEVLTDAEIHALIFAPGFSTAVEVTELSGRGVGMDVVKRNVEEMRGRIDVGSKPGQGTSVRLVLPLTLAIIDGMLIACGPERFIVPSLSIVESLRPTAGMLYSLGEREEFVDVRGELLPLFRLGKLFNVPGAVSDPTQALVVVVESGGRKIVLMADDVLAQQQVVIKPLGAGLPDSDHFSGAAILSDGRAGLILNIDRLIAQSAKNTTRGRRELPTPEARP